MSTTFSVSTVNPDWEDLVSQLQAISLTKDAWSDLVPTGTGQSIIEMIAAVGAYDQYSIESAFQEAFPQTAKNDSSIFAASQFLGVRLSRKKPMQITATLVSSSGGDVTLPAYTQFVGGGSYFFNRDSILVTTSPQAVTLYQGKVKAVSLPGISQDYQVFVTQETGFLVSDSDVLVFLNGTAIPIITQGLWQLKNAEGVQDITLPTGQLALIFGSALYGSRPTVSDAVGILYAVTSGLDAAALITNTASLTNTSNLEITCTATSNPTLGGDEQPASLYKTVAPSLFGAFGSAVTGRQYKSTLFDYPDATIVDGLTFAQRESNPKALEWMNLVRCVILPETGVGSWTDTSRQDFTDWYETQTMYSTRFFVEDPAPYPINVDVTVYCDNTTILSEAKSDARTAVIALFEPKQGCIGRDVYLSDIWEAVKHANSGIDHVVINAPTTDTILTRNTVQAPTYTLDRGTLVAGNYNYGIGYVSSLGGLQICAANWLDVTVPINSSVILTWLPVPNVTSYKVWGRQSSGTLGLLATLSSATLTYTDSGSDAVVPPLLTRDTQAMYFGQLGTLTVTALASSRV